MRNFDPKWLKRIGVCPLKTSDSSSISMVAISSPHDEFLLEKVRREFNPRPSAINPPLRVETEILTPGKLKFAIAQQSIAQQTADQELSEENLKSFSNSWEAEPIINLVDSLIEQAIAQGATDIHIEPEEENLRIRFRRDGLLKKHRDLPHWATDPILVRIKILSAIDITDKRIPHDGSFTYSGLQGNINVRVSTLPVQHGEKCVLRLLPQAQDKSIIPQGIASLNFSTKMTGELRRIFQSPQGLFLVTGPTGSGKTTTLHSGLQEIIQREINVVTVEDPVEYTLRGANQVQVNEKCGFTFARALRSILRQDPDAILVGEIRDEETASIALRAAQTGHLVVSTLHTNNAMAAFSRLNDLGISSKLLEDSLLGIMAQRLVRQKGGGRRAIAELLLPDGSYVDGNLRDSASQLIQQGVVTKEEVDRVLGNLCYIGRHEDF